MSSLNLNAREPRLFRTYKASKFQSSNCKIWEASRATIAAPNFFKSIDIHLSMAVWAATTQLNRSSQRQNSFFLINISRASLALEQDKLRRSVSLHHGGFNARYRCTSSTLFAVYAPIARRAHKTPCDALNTPQGFISASTSSRGCRKLGLRNGED